MRGRPEYDKPTDRMERSDWWGVVLETPDPSRLGHFYADLLDWKIATDSEHWVTVGPDEGVAYLGFQFSPDYVPPVWPAENREQQMMMHLDFEVVDLDDAVEDAVELGAVVHPHQPQETARVLLDPDGHPFCLYT